MSETNKALISGKLTNKKRQRIQRKHGQSIFTERKTHRRGNWLGLQAYEEMSNLTSDQRNKH